TAAPEVPLPEEVPVTTVPGGDQAAPVIVEPPVQENRKKGREGIDANAPPKSLRGDHADLQPSGSSRGGKSLAAMQLCLASNIFVYEGVPADVSDPDPLAFADAPSPPPADVIRSSQGVAATGDPGSENVSSPTVVGSPGSVYRPEWGVTNGSLLDTPDACQDLVDHAAPPGYFSELRHMHNEDFLGQYNMNLARQVAMGSQLRLRFEQEAKLLRKSVAQVARREQRIQARESEIKNLEVLLKAEADMKRAAEEKSARLIQELEKMRIAKGMSEGLKHGVEHGHAQRTIESLEAYDPEAEAKFAAALQSLKDLKLPLLDQLEGLQDAPMDVIIASLYLEDDTEVRDPRNPWACIEEIKLADAIAANVSRAEQKKRSRIVCRTHEGLALILVDAATQTDPDA
nr:hypothetical protein [Tanacetum cinerariifolium]